MHRFKEFFDDKFVRKLLLVALVPLGLCALTYFIRFGYFLKYPISANQGDWGTFGDFIGGVLNPIYGFLAFAGVVYTVLLQKDQIEIATTEQKLSEIQHLITGQAIAIDKVLYEQKKIFRNNETSVFTLLRAISDDSLTIELDRAAPISIIYSDTRESILNVISSDLIYIEEQLSHLMWCLETYINAKGNSVIEEFYVGKYRHVVYMMKQIDYLHIDDVSVFFKADEVKASLIEALRNK